MPGSDTALEEVMCRVLGPLLQDGSVAKSEAAHFILGQLNDEFAYPSASSLCLLPYGGDRNPTILTPCYIYHNMNAMLHESTVFNVFWSAA